MSDSTLRDVIIAGAGPVGLFLACELALAGLDVVIVEQAARPQAPLKLPPLGMRGLSVATGEALYRRGLLDELLTAADAARGVARPARTQAGHFAGIPIDPALVDLARWPYRLPNPASTNFAADMASVESVLATRAQALGVEIRRGLAVTDCADNGDQVAVHAGDVVLRARWLVGCDGGRSVVRKLAGFDFPGTAPAFTAYYAVVDIAEPHRLRPGRNATPSGLLHEPAGPDRDCRLRRRGLRPFGSDHARASAGGIAPCIRDRRHAHRTAPGDQLHRPRQARDRLSSRPRAVGRRCRAHSFGAGRPGPECRPGRRHEPRLEACGDSAGHGARSTARHVSCRTPAGWPLGAGLDPGTGRPDAAEPAGQGHGKHRARPGRYPRWRDLLCRAALGQFPCTTIWAAPIRWPATARPTCTLPMAAGWQTTSTTAPPCWSISQGTTPLRSAADTLAWAAALCMRARPPTSWGWPHCWCGRMDSSPGHRIARLTRANSNGQRCDG